MVVDGRSGSSCQSAGSASRNTATSVWNSFPSTILIGFPPSHCGGSLGRFGRGRSCGWPATQLSHRWVEVGRFGPAAARTIVESIVGRAKRATVRDDQCFGVAPAFPPGPYRPSLAADARLGFEVSESSVARVGRRRVPASKSGGNAVTAGGCGKAGRSHPAPRRSERCATVTGGAIARLLEIAVVLVAQVGIVADAALIIEAALAIGLKPVLLVLGIKAERNITLAVNPDLAARRILAERGS